MRLIRIYEILDRKRKLGIIKTHNQVEILVRAG
jgi:hypothetical protein